MPAEAVIAAEVMVGREDLQAPLDREGCEVSIGGVIPRRVGV
jgi:hypothetical protein